MTLKNNLVGQEMKLGFHGFLVGVEIEDGTPLEMIIDRLGGSIKYMDGIGKVDVTYFGRVDEEAQDNLPSPAGLQEVAPGIHVITESTSVFGGKRS